MQLVVKSLDLDDQTVFAGHQFVLQLGHFSLVGWLCQVVAQDVDQQVKQDYAGGTREARHECEVNRRGTLARLWLNSLPGRLLDYRRDDVESDVGCSERKKKHLRDDTEAPHNVESSRDTLHLWGF